MVVIPENYKCDCGWPDRYPYCYAAARNKFVKRCGKAEYEYQQRQIGVVNKVTDKGLTFKLWIPGRAAANGEKIPKEEKCVTCKGSGEDDVRYVKPFGYSHIPCKVCRGLGRKRPDRPIDIAYDIRTDIS